MDSSESAPGNCVMVKLDGEKDRNPNRGWRTYSSLLVEPLKGLLLIVLLPISFIAVFMSLFFFLAEVRFKQPVLDTVPRMFPLLVLVPGEPDGQLRGRIVYHKDIEEFLEEHPEHTFLIPEEQEEAINNQLDQDSRYHRRDFDWQSPYPWHASFQVEQREPGRQKLKVSATWDDDRVNIGWYEATDQDFTPTQYQFFFGPGLVMRVFMESVVITIVLWLVAWILLWLIRRRRRKRIDEEATIEAGIQD